MSSHSSADTKKVAIVTGAARGIGRAIALRLAKDGFIVVVSDLPTSGGAAQDVVNEAAAFGSTCIFMACDITEEKQVVDLINFTMVTYKRLDVMVANAGLCIVNPVTQTTSEELQRLLQTNVQGTLFCIKNAGSTMIKMVEGGIAKGSELRIIAAGSLAGKKGGFFHSAYVATKFAIRGLVQSAAMEFGPYGITVNSYAPGVIRTDMMKNAGERFTELVKGMMPQFEQGGVEAYAKLGADMSALKRNGQPEEVANLVSFLASDQSSFITGQSISIDGGTNFD